jgi:hypothetical protein
VFKLVETPQNSTLTLTAIILVYLICNLPRLTINLLEHYLLSEIYKDECGCYLVRWWLSSLIRSSHVLLTFNSSVNLLIYIFVSKRFKKLFILRSKNCHTMMQTQVLKLKLCKKENEETCRSYDPAAQSTAV